MPLFITPTSTIEKIWLAVSQNIGNDGIKGMAIMVIGLVGTFWVIELLIGAFGGYKNEPPAPIDKKIDSDDY